MDNRISVDISSSYQNTGLCPPPFTYLRVTVQIHLTFPYEFGKGHYAFYPMKLSRFAEEKNHQKNSIIILRVLGIQTS